MFQKKFAFSMRVNGDEAGRIFAWGTLKTKWLNQKKRMRGVLATRSTYNLVMFHKLVEHFPEVGAPPSQHWRLYFYKTTKIVLSRFCPSSAALCRGTTTYCFTRTVGQSSHGMVLFHPPGYL